MAFFDPKQWEGKLYSRGWAKGGAGNRSVVEPATGDIIGNFGVASPRSLGIWTLLKENRIDSQGQLIVGSISAPIGSSSEVILNHR